jgi:hypothetical protein
MYFRIKLAVISHFSIEKKQKTKKTKNILDGHASIPIIKLYNVGFNTILLLVH